MKIAKKILSVLLSIMMVVTSISVCFSTFVFAADAQYTDSDVRTLVNDAVAAGANSVAKWKAAEAVYAYATETVTSSYGPTIGDKNKNTGRVGTDLLADNFIKYVLKEEITSASAAAQFVRSVLNPAGATLYGYGENLKNDSYSFFSVSKYNPAIGTDYTNDTNCPKSVKNNWINPVKKEVTISRNVNEYLMSVDDLNAIPDSGFATTVTYTYNNEVNRYVWIVKVTAAKNFGTNKGDVTGCCWHYLADVSRNEGNFNTTAKAQLLSAKAKFEGIKNTTADAYLASYGLGTLISQRDSAMSEYNSLVSAYNLDVIKKHVASDINAVLTNLNEAIERLNNAATNMRNMIAYINNGFTPITTANVGEVNIDDYNALYAAANAAYTAVAAIPDATIESVKSGAPDLAGFSKEASAQFLADLNESISLYNAVQLKATIDNAYAANNATIADKYVSEDIISNEAVAALKGNIYSLDSAFAALTVTARITVFGDTTYAPMSELYNNISTLSAVRDAEVDYSGNYYQYFEPKFAENIGALKNAAITALYDEALAKKDAYNAAYAGYVASLGQDTVDTIFFDVVYGGEEKPMSQAAAEYVESLKTNIIARNDAQLKLIKEYSDVPYVDFNNITAVKNATSRFDSDLYSFVETKGWLTAENVADYALADSVIQKVKDFVATGGLDFTELHHHNSEGVFTVREADSNTDIARHEGEDFYVTESNINASIAKLDKFITSKDFTSLVGLEDLETGEAYEDLPTAITEVLNENLFSDKMVNTLIATIYPMLADTLGNLFSDLSSITDMILPCDMDHGKNVKCSGMLDLATLVDGMGGKLHIFFDGQKGTDSLITDLDNLGLRIYPQQLATMPEMAQYPEIKAVLEDAGKYWKTITENTDYLDEDGNLTFVWGVHDYDSFIDVVSMIFESIGPLLTALVSGKTYNGELGSTAAFAEVKGLSYSILKNINTEAYAKAKINIEGQNLFQTLWIPAMEALGVTDYTASGFTFANVNSGSNYRQIADAMFRPLLELISQLSAQPIDKVLSVLPTLMYLLSMDYIQGTLNNINIPLKVNLEITDFTGGGLDWVLDLAKGVINGALPEIAPELILGNLVDLADLLGFDLSNVNDVFDFVLEKVGIDAKLPVLNAGQFVLASHAEKGVSSQRPGGTRNRLVADKADVFYLLLKYLLSAVGDSELINAIIDFVVAKENEKNPDADPFELPEVVYTIINTINNGTDEALAALVEIVNPQKYDTMAFDWYTSPFSYSSDIENFDENSLPYLKYSNDWTKDKADYLIENIDEILETVLSVAGVEQTSINKALQDAVASLFTNLNFTGFVEMLVKLGYIIDNEFVYDLIKREFDLDLRTWAKTFGDSFPEAKEEYPDAVIPDSVPVIEGVTFDADTGIWTIGGTEFVDGDRSIFLDLFTTVCGSFANIISALFTGTDISLFNNAITILGYDNYKNSIGVLFEILGMNQPAVKEAMGEFGGVLSQAEYAAMDPADAFNFLTKQLFAWLDYMFEDNTVAKIIELIPRFVYFFESNGLAAVMHNMLMPILVLLDVIRPILNIDVNAILSTLISDVLNSVSDALRDGTEIEINIDAEKILAVIAGEGVSDLDPDHKAYNIDINHLKTGEVHQIVDTLLGTSLATSPLVSYCVPGLCAGKKEIPNSVIGTAYGSDVSAADTVTILVSALLETLQSPCYDEYGNETTNGLQVCGFIQNILDNLEEPVAINVTELYDSIITLINGLDIPYENPNWGYMFSGNFDVNGGSVTLPDHTINYLQYDNDWDKETAKVLDANFDALVELVLDAVIKDSTAAELINSLLEDEVYKDANLNAIVELIVGVFAGLEDSLRNLLGTALDVNIDSWFDMCDIERDEDGNVTKVTCTYDFGVDGADDKKAAFVDGIKTVLEPAQKVLGWIFFGEDYKFFVGSEKDSDGNFVYNDILTISGGEGYAFGLVPVLEALGCDVKAADEFYNETTGKYDVGEAVNSIIDALLDRVDEIAGQPAHKLLAVLPNIIYFINADGITVSLKNILSSVNSLIAQVAPIIGDDSITVEKVLGDMTGIDVSDLSMEAILNLVTEKTDAVITDAQKEIITTFYIGKLSQFVSANGEYAYKMEYTDKESRADMITIVLSVAVEFIRENRTLLTGVIGEETYNAIVELLAGYDGMLTYRAPNWAYMYEGEDALSQLSAGLPQREGETYANYTKYTNSWNKETATFLTENLDEIVTLLLKTVAGTDTTLGVMLENAIAGEIYRDEVLASLLETVVKLLAGLDDTLVETAGAVLGADLDTWFDWCEIEKDADGAVLNVTCTKDFGIDSKATTAEKKAAFISAVTEALAPANRVLAWLFFGQDYTFLNDANGEDLITITGGEGYDFTIVPVLEALSVADVKGAAQYSLGGGKYDVSAAVGDVVSAILDKITEICGDNTIDTVLDMLPNLVYFINADGISTSVMNLLVPVNYLLEKLEPVIGGVDLEETIGFPISDITFETIFTLLEDQLGIKVMPENKEFIETFYMGQVNSYTSANGTTAYRMTYSSAEGKADMVTILISILLENVRYAENEEALTELLGEDTYNTIVSLLSVYDGQFTYTNPNWAYMYAGDDALAQLIASGLPQRTGASYANYTKYTNNWNEETASYIRENLQEIVDAVISSISETDTTLGVMLENAIAGEIYKDEVLNSLLETVVKLLGSVDSLLAKTAGAALGADLDTWFGWCEIERDADGVITNVTCTKNWGINSKLTTSGKKSAFIAALTEALAPANRVLSWLFLGEHYTFLNDMTGADIITINGGEGYDYAIVPILEALGCEAKAADAYLNADGSYDVSAVVADVVTALCDKVSEVCGDNTIDVVLDLLLNVVYFINADGISVSVKNLLAPVDFLLEKLQPVIGEVDLEEAIGFPIKNITFETIFGLLADSFGINLRPENKEFIETFYMGKVDAFASANGETAYRMTYSDKETSRDMMTILVSILLENVRYEDNRDALTELLGEDVYQAVTDVLSIMSAKAMQDFSWLYKEYADTDKTFSAVNTSVRYHNTYDEIWTRDMAEYIVNNFPEFVDNLICLLGLKINGIEITDLTSLINEFINANLYTQANADAILNALRGVVANLAELEPYGKYITAVLKTSIGVDLTVWNTMTVTVADGSKEDFANAVTKMIAPLAPLFKVLLIGEDLRFFYDINGKDQILIPGSEGYAYGIVPLMEALGCKNVLTPDKFAAVLRNDTNKAVRAVVDPILDRIDDIMENPANKIFDMLPAVVYFINSNGIDTSVKNILNSVDTVIAALEPIIGASDICTLAGIDLQTMDFNWLVKVALDFVKDSAGIDLTPLAINAVAELIVGKVVSYKSANGETYYTMKYTGMTDKEDMLTVILRLLTEFVVCDANVPKIESALAKYVTNEQCYKIDCAIVRYLAKKVKECPSMSAPLAAVYYVCYGINEGTDKAHDIYHDVNGTWQSIFKKLDKNDNPYVREVSSGLQKVLDKYLEGVVDSDGIASQGALTFWEKIIKFFKDFFAKIKNLFK